MNCPACKKAMVVIELDGVEIDHCFQCGGVWLDQGELERLLEQNSIETVEIVDKKSKKQSLKCPICNRKMAEVYWKAVDGVFVDRCKINDGLWFERGELSKIVQSVESQTHRLTAMLADVFKQ